MTALNYMPEDLPENPLDRAVMLQNILLSACEGDRSSTSTYAALRTEFMNDPGISSLVPQFIRTCRDLQHFWGYKKGVSPQWEPRRHHIRNELAPLLDHLEGRNRSPIDTAASEVLASFDADGVHSAWAKALTRRHTDPEGAITIARTLLETVCKRVLELAEIPYKDSDDLPDLYKAVAKHLNIAPSQHSEEAFRRILGGCTNVVEALGSLRNKIGDAHGRGGRPIRPASRHAHLAVNLAGAMATFVVETYQAKRE